MKLEENPQLPMGSDMPALYQVLSRLFRSHAQKVNQLADGRIGGCDLVLAEAPTTGQFQRGDFVRNSAPAELGSASSKYVIEGWLCTVAGSPGTFVQKRFLTGN